MALTDELTRVLKKLRLSGVMGTLDLRTKEAVEGDLSHSEFLFRLCNDEVERREAKQLELRMRRAPSRAPSTSTTSSGPSTPKSPRPRSSISRPATSWRSTTTSC